MSNIISLYSLREIIIKSFPIHTRETKLRLILLLDGVSNTHHSMLSAVLAQIISAASFAPPRGKFSSKSNKSGFHFSRHGRGACFTTKFEYYHTTEGLDVRCSAASKFTRKRGGCRILIQECKLQANVQIVICVLACGSCIVNRAGCLTRPASMGSTIRSHNFQELENVFHHPEK